MDSVYLRPFSMKEESDSTVRYPVDSGRYRSVDGSLLEVVNPLNKMPPDEIESLKSIFDRRAGSWEPLDRSGVWRYREFLPAFKPFKEVVTMPEGNTPVYSLPECARYTGARELYAKHQGANPTGSFKDNGMTAAVTAAKLSGCDMVACASTGNTSASMAAYAARAGMKSLVFIPDGQIAYGKLSQALDFGAATIQIEGDFDKAMTIVEEICSKESIYLLNSINPFRIEGQKTIMIELLHQLNWEVPDWIIVPGGNLGNSSSFGKAFKELKAAGFIDKIPRIAIIQADGADPLYSCYVNKSNKLTPVQAETRATAIRIGNPVSYEKALYAIGLTNGLVEEVSEEEIAAAKCMIGRDGIGSEPASATTVAGCKKLIEKNVINPDEKIVCILTGHLLKDPDYTVDFHTDELYLDVKRKVDISGNIRISTSGMSNRPVKLPGETDVILEYIRKNLKKGI